MKLDVTQLIRFSCRTMTPLVFGNMLSATPTPGGPWQDYQLWGKTIVILMSLLVVTYDTSVGFGAKRSKKRLLSTLRYSLIKSLKDQELIATRLDNDLALLTKVPTQGKTARLISAWGVSQRSERGYRVTLRHVISIHRRKGPCRFRRIPTRQINQRNPVLRSSLGMRRQVVSAPPVRIVFFRILIRHILLSQQINVEGAHAAEVVPLIVRRNQLVEIRNFERRNRLIIQICSRIHHLERVFRRTLQNPTESRVRALCG